MDLYFNEPILQKPIGLGNEPRVKGKGAEILPYSGDSCRIGDEVAAAQSNCAVVDHSM